MLPRLTSSFCAQGILPAQASGCWDYRSVLHGFTAVFFTAMRAFCFVLFFPVVFLKHCLSHIVEDDCKLLAFLLAPPRLEYRMNCHTKPCKV